MAKFKPESTWAEPSFFRSLNRLATKEAESREIKSLVDVLAAIEVLNDRTPMMCAFARDCYAALQGAEPESK